MNQKRPIVILAHQRSGTTAFRRLLVATERVRNFGEVFHTDDRQTELPWNFFNFRKHNPPPYVVNAEPAVREYFFEYLAHLSRLADKSWFLLDIKYNSWCNLAPAWQDLAREPFPLSLFKQVQTPIVHITRRNLFRQFLSLEYANATGRWHFSNGASEVAPEIGLDIDPFRAEEAMRLARDNRDRFRDWLAGYPLAVEIEYEESFVDGLARTTYLERALHSIGVSVELDENVTLRKTPVDLPRLVTNRDVLLHYFRGTSFEQDVGDALGRKSRELSRSAASVRGPVTHDNLRHAAPAR